MSANSTLTIRLDAALIALAVPPVAAACNGEGGATVQHHLEANS